jgi:hypothetical protein
MPKRTSIDFRVIAGAPKDSCFEPGVIAVLSNQFSFGSFAIARVETR